MCEAEGWKVERTESGEGRGAPERRRGISEVAVAREWQTCITGSETQVSVLIFCFCRLILFAVTILLLV